MTNTESIVRLKRQPNGKYLTEQTSQYINQREGLTKDDELMLKTSLSSKLVNPLLIPSDALRKVLAQIKEDMKRNPRLQLPEDSNTNIWNYYPIMKIIPIVMDDFLLIILTIPLKDQSLEMNLYKVYNLPALHPELKVEFTYELEGEYLDITKKNVHNYFQRFNEEYQDITRYSLIEDLGIVQLTPKEIAKIPDRLTALP